MVHRGRNEKFTVKSQELECIKLYCEINSLVIQNACDLCIYGVHWLTKLSFLKTKHQNMIAVSNVL